MEGGSLNLLDIFGKCDGIKRLCYEDFNPLAWDYNDYFRYMSFCDEIRSAVIITDYLKKMDGMKITDHQRFDGSLVDQRVKALFDWLQQFSDETLPEPELAHQWLSLEKNYDCGSNMLMPDRNIHDPGLLYQAPFHFTLHIEQFIAKTLKKEPLFEFSDVTTYDELSEEELKRGIEWAKLNIARTEDQPPEFPDDVDRYTSLMMWAKKQAKYNCLSDWETILDDYEEELEKRKSPEFNPHENVLYIYQRSNIICKKDKHSIVDVNCIIPKLNGDSVCINAQYCMNCQKFIISEDSYTSYLDDYLYLPIKLRRVGEDGTFPQHLYSRERSSNSPLSLAGYSVREGNGLTEEERHNLLASLIDNGVMEKHEIIGYLELFVNTNGAKYNMARAVHKWTRDAQFVREYNMDQQDTFRIKKIKRY